MKFETTFDKFLTDVVNLNDARFNVAKSAIGTITSVLQNNDVFRDKLIDAKPQGSFRQETIIKPVNSDQDFDVDLLVELKIVDGWQPKDYLDKLAAEFQKMDRYKDKVDRRGKTRCVTIDYESDFHMDIIPAINATQGQFIMNKITNQFEPTDGDGYAQWFERQNKITGGKYLKKIVRLMKYVRDTSGNFEIKSVVLTTLLGNQVLPTDQKDTHFPNLPTAFLRIISRLDGYLQGNPMMPSVTNPVLSTENFNRHWDQKKYDDFRKWIHTYTEAATNAYADANETSSLKSWQRIFGTKFSTSTSQAITTRDPGEQFLSDLNIREALAHTLTIDAIVKQDGFRPFNLNGSTNILKKKRKLEFFIQHTSAMGPYDIKWKVKNLGTEAANAGDLRGEITDDKGFRIKYENTKYTGAHYVECYLIQGNVCIAKNRIVVPITNLV